MATHSSILAWWFHEQRSLMGYSSWGRKESCGWPKKGEGGREKCPSVIGAGTQARWDSSWKQGWGEKSPQQGQGTCGSSRKVQFDFVIQKRDVRGITPPSILPQDKSCQMQITCLGKLQTQEEKLSNPKEKWNQNMFREEGKIHFSLPWLRDHLRGKEAEEDNAC